MENAALIFTGLFFIAVLFYGIYQISRDNHHSASH